MQPLVNRNGAARSTSVLASGAVLWAFVILIPAIHLGVVRRFALTDFILAAIPLAALASGALLRKTVISVLVFPVATLPLLLRFEEMTGPRVYGPGAFIALAAATVAHILVTLVPEHIVTGRGSRSGTTEARLLGTHTLAFTIVGLVPLLALHFDRAIGARLAAAYPDYEQRAAVLLTLLWLAIWLFIIRRFLIGEVTGVALNRTARLSGWYRFKTEATATARMLGGLFWAALLAGLAAILLAAVMNQR
ncbi:MAG: putative membrane protein [Myxococcota bacterium]|jgi:uncharacterized membrane protein